jgi:hypothetical protein
MFLIDDVVNAYSAAPGWQPSRLASPMLVP